MKKILIFAGLIIAIGVIIGLLFLPKGSLLPSENSIEFDKAPDFALEDYNGNIVHLTDFQGKIVVVNSWAAWCSFCKEELLDFTELQQEFKDEISVIAIDRAEPLQKVKEFTDSVGITDKILFLLDPDDSFYTSIGGFSMPETLFIDREGNIRIHKRGPMELEEMKEKVNSIL